LENTSAYIVWSTIVATNVAEQEDADVKIASLVTASLVGMFGTSQATAQDGAEGEALYKKNCRGCHGPTAKGLASYPRLAGQPPEYLVERLEKYRAGEKLGPNTPLMAPRAKKLSDEDIINIVNYIVTTFE